MTKPKTKKLKLSHKGWAISIVKGLMTVKRNDYKREYDLTYPNGGIEHKRGSEYFYVRCEDFYYQFKFEENDFFVGDKYTNEDELMEEVASYVFDGD